MGDTYATKLLGTSEEPSVVKIADSYFVEESILARNPEAIPRVKPLKRGTRLETPGHSFRILDKIGDGGFGITYKVLNLIGFAAQGSSGEWVPEGAVLALKECCRREDMVRDADGLVRLRSGHLESGKEVRKHFIKEARLMAKLQRAMPQQGRSSLKAGIMPIYYAGVCDHDSSTSEHDGIAPGIFFYVMPYVDGGATLFTAQLRGHEIVSTLYYLLLSLEKMHTLGAYVRKKDDEPALHRDIKPSNIMITKDGYPVFIDYGGMVNSRIRTPAYAAPEQTVKDEPHSWATDIYSLGATFYTLLAKNKHKSAKERMSMSTVGDPYHALATDKELAQRLKESCARAAARLPESAARDKMRRSADSTIDRFLKGLDKAMNLNPQMRWQSALEWRNYVFSDSDFDATLFRAEPEGHAEETDFESDSIHINSSGEITLPNYLEYMEPPKYRKVLSIILWALCILAGAIIFTICLGEIIIK